MILFTGLFAFVSFKSKKTRMAKNIVIFQNFEKCLFSNLHIFTEYQILTNFIPVSYLTLLAL